MEDLRIIKTKKSLFEALINLLKEKSFEDVKVSNICSTALVNRSTFYSHYNDKYELLSDLMISYQNTFIEELNSKTESSTPKQYYMQIIRVLFKHIESQKDLYKAIMINNKNSIIMDMFYDTINEDILKHLQSFSSSNKNNVPYEIVAKFYSSAVTNICSEWLTNGNKYSQKQIIDYLEKLIPDSPFE